MNDFWFRWMKTHGYSDQAIEKWNGKRWICPDCGATETLKSDEEAITTIICPYCQIRGERTIMVPRVNDKTKVNSIEETV